MTFLEHLDELRSRLSGLRSFRRAVAGCWLVSDRILAFLLAPIREHLFVEERSSSSPDERSWFT